MTKNKTYSIVGLLLCLALFVGALVWTTRLQASAQEPDDPSSPSKSELEAAEREAYMARKSAEMEASYRDLEAMSATPCVNGFAGPYACLNTDLMAFMPLSTFGAGSSNDVQGWTDPLDGTEYAVLGLNNGTAFIDISDPENPVYLGKLPGHNGSTSTWRELDVMGNYVYIGSEASGHGMQIFDLTELRDVTVPPVTFSETAHYDDFGSSHTVGGNPATNFMYAMGSNTCSGGLHMVDVTDPLNPVNAGCFSSDGYSHDAQCIIYNGPDTTYQGQEICFNSNEDTLTIVDVTNKASPLQIARVPYAGVGYTHQTAILDGHAYLLMDDELDELDFGHNSRTRIWDISDLDAPFVLDFYDGPNPNIDHNIYIWNGNAYEANYTSGLQIFDISDVPNGNLTMIAYFDSYTPSNSATFSGAWAVYPYFESGLVLITGIGEGMYIVKPVLSPQFSLTAESTELAVCMAGSESTTLDVIDQNGYTGTVTLSAFDLPTGTTATFDPSSVIVPGTSTMTVTVSTTPPGTYPFTILGDDGTLTNTLDASLSIYAGVPTSPSLTSPADEATGVSLQPTFTWTGDAPSYTIEIATDAGFTNIVDTATVEDTSYTPVIPLSGNTTFYWRVIGANICGNSTSEIFSFTTVDINMVCNVNPVIIPGAGSGTPYPSDITLSGYGNSLLDINVHLLDLTHTYPDDIDMLLVGPQGQNLLLMSDAGGGGNITTIDLTLDDAAAFALPDATTLATGSYRPANYVAGDTFPAPAPIPSGSTTLAVFNSTDPNGTWSLYIVDDESNDEGTLGSGWCLEFTTDGNSTATPRRNVKSCVNFQAGFQPLQGQ